MVESAVVYLFICFYLVCLCVYMIVCEYVVCMCVVCLSVSECVFVFGICIYVFGVWFYNIYVYL